MAEIKNDNLDVRAPKHVDKRYSKANGVPYSTVAEAHAAITYKVLGLPVMIGPSNSDFKLHWYKGGLNVENLVPVVIELGYTPVPTSRQINSHPLVADIFLTNADVGLNNVANVNTTLASNLLGGTIPAGRYGAATIPTTAINATGGTEDDFLSKGGEWKQPTSTNLYFSDKFSGTNTEESPIDISVIVTKFNSYTTTQKNALTSLQDGDTVYDKTLKKLQTWDASTSAWV